VTDGLGQLVLIGNIVMTPAAQDLLLERAIDTVFLSTNGRFRGRLQGGLSGNIRLRMAQYKRGVDDRFATTCGRAIVAGKCHNMSRYLQRFSARHGDSGGRAEALAAIGRAEHGLAGAASLDEIRGFEGAATAAYFAGFASTILVDDFEFNGRHRRPPIDPVNALLSLGYTFVLNAVVAAVEIVGLDPHLGTLHNMLANRPSLACDLMEEYRVLLVDALVVEALNRGILKIDDFVYLGDGEPVEIKTEAVRAFAMMFGKRLSNTRRYFEHPSADDCGMMTYRQIIERQSRQYARVVLGDPEQLEYLPLKMS